MKPETRAYLYGLISTIAYKNVILLYYHYATSSSCTTVFIYYKKVPLFVEAQRESSSAPFPPSIIETLAEFSKLLFAAAF